MTLKQLREYRSICDEITDIKQQLDGSFVGDTVQSASKHPYDKRSVHIEGFPSDGHTLSLLARLSVLERSRTEIEQFVHSIDDYDIKLIIQYRYLRGKRPMSWQAIASRLNYLSEHTPKRKIQKYFQNGGNGGF